ncbi:MAG: globin [Rhodopseudomonas sp.]|uniref:globin n=1 Tax=Rhodopseudomonas sp. TaxID=1078 RepID=UPI00184BD320|nr:globin [Rhodopseudomonas sp.]NVN86332.1 globin [Rhodopseudomonas sp.]
MTIPISLIEQSLELAAVGCDDLTPLVYRRLFSDHPETESMFRREPKDLVKGSMLALTIDALIDFAGERKGAFRMIECEVLSHDAYGTAPQLFRQFFWVIANTLRELLGDQWSPPMEQAWQQLLIELDRIVESNQTVQTVAPP